MKKLNVLISAGGTALSRSSCAFTMAEILLSLTIIGVVAAITLPSLTGNINERTWNTQRKALYARFSQAIALMPALNGYGTLTEGNDSTSAVDTAAETFVTEGLSKVLKINNICDSEHLADCGVVSKLTTLGGAQVDIPKTMTDLNSNMTRQLGVNMAGYSQRTSMINTKVAAFETQNGESIVVYYNPNCTGNLGEDPSNGKEGVFTQNKVCVNFVYDLNGNKGPNTVGKDIGVMTAIYPTDTIVVAPYPAVNFLADTYAVSPTSEGEISALKACSNYDSEYRLPNSHEAISMFVNSELMKPASGALRGSFITSTKIKNSAGITVLIMIITSSSNFVGQLDDFAPTMKQNVWCVKR